MDESTENTGRSLWAWIGGVLGTMALAGGIASLWMARSAQMQERRFRPALPELGLTERTARITHDVRRAGDATARGVGAGLSAAWDVAVGGADAVRTKAKVLPTITSAVGETSASLGSAAGQAAGATRSFAGTTARTMMWLSLAGSLALLIYMPDPKQRDRFFARSRRYFQNARQVVNRAGPASTETSNMGGGGTGTVAH